MTDNTTSHRYLNVGGRVLAAVDQSAYTVSTSHYAAWAARRLDAPLEYLHVLDRHPEMASTADFSGSLALDAQKNLLQELAALDENRSKLAQNEGRALLQQAKTIAAETCSIAAETRLRHGSLVDTLTELENDVRLFVLGKRGQLADSADGELGSEVEHVVRAVHRPLLIASREYTEVKRVLIAFDGSATTRKGVEMVAASPLFSALEIRVVTVGSVNAANERQQSWALETLGAAGLVARGSIHPGDPVQVISKYIVDESVDMLVMGAYGHSRIRQLIVGSTTTAMLRTCRIPALLLR